MDKIHEPSVDWLCAGRVGAAHGIKGMFWIHSLTDPYDNIFNYEPWQLCLGSEQLPVKVETWRRQSKGWVVKLQGFDDRNAIEAWVGADILIRREVMRQALQGESLWSDLKGMRVCTLQGQDYGVVSALMETGANDVLIVQGDARSVDQREHLVPWIVPQVICNVDSVTGKIVVDWDFDF